MFGRLGGIWEYYKKWVMAKIDAILAPANAKNIPKCELINELYVNCELTCTIGS